MKDKVHLTSEGLEKIRKIKIGMNKGRLSKKIIIGARVTRALIQPSQ